MKNCVGCGYCCIKAPCEACRRIYPGATECPALYWNEEKKMYRCKLMELPGDVGRGFREEIYANTGCSSTLGNEWRNDVRPRFKQTTFVNPLPRIFQIFINCLGKNFVSPDAIFLATLDMKTTLVKDGYDKQEVEAICTSIINGFKNNRSKQQEEFMG